MSEDNIRITVSRRSVVQVAPYESEEASSSIEWTMNAASSQEEVLDAATGWRNQLAIANFEALGVGYDIGDVAVRRLQKSVSGGNESVAVAPAAPPAPRSAGSGGTTDELWRDLMNNSDKWFTNWPEQLAGNDNPARPAYRRAGDGKGLWLTNKDKGGTSAFPEWFVCPKTGKTGDDLATVGRELRQKSFSK
jgi:hypothetical protein